MISTAQARKCQKSYMKSQMIGASNDRVKARFVHQRREEKSE